MIYVVSGYMRTGTSMMMRALEAGGLDAAYSGKRDSLIDISADEHYRGNPSLMELDPRKYHTGDFPRGYEGRLVKCHMPGVCQMCVGEPYRVVFMMRNPDEIRESYHAFSGNPYPPITGERYVKLCQTVVEVLDIRPDVHLTVLWYRNVISNPLLAFQQLKRRGWPIDPVKAAAVVDPDLCRFKSEDMAA